MDWILGEVLESLKNEREALSLRIDQYSEYEDNFKSAVATDDKFEVGRHEYWRGRYLEAVENYERIKAIIKDIYDMIDEETKSESDYSEHIRQLKSIGRGYIYEDDGPEPTGGFWSTEKGDVY